MLNFIGEFVAEFVFWGACRGLRRLLGWETESEREDWERKHRNDYVPPQYVMPARSEPEREATRSKIRERVAARHARDAARRGR